MKILIVLLLSLSLGGCALRQAATQYEETTQAYRACLLNNQQAPQKCEALRLAAEADAEKLDRYRRAATMTPQHDVIIRPR